MPQTPNHPQLSQHNPLEAIRVPDEGVPFPFSKEPQAEAAPVHAEQDTHSGPEPGNVEQEAQPEPVNDEPIKIVEPEPAISANERAKREFFKKVMEARSKPAVNVAPEPVSTRVLNQTELELEAGRKAVAKHAQQMKNRPPPPAPGLSEGTMTPVFRPAVIFL